MNKTQPVGSFGGKVGVAHWVRGVGCAMAVAGLATLEARALDVTVNPGGNIQAALDQVGNAGGGNVYVNYGTYNISTTLTVPNNVQLWGKGTSRPVIKLAAHANKQVIKNKSIPFNNCKVNYLLVDGGLSNADLDGNLYNNTLGIDLSDQHTTTTSQNSLAVNCYVQNCSMGINFGRTHGCTIDTCTVNNCGGAPSGSTPGLHNLYISTVDNCLIKYLTSTYCRSGIGLKLTDFYGDQSEASIIVQNCNLNNNKDRGLAAYDLSNLEVRNNTCNNNGSSGINILRTTSGGELTGNTCLNNVYKVDVSYDIWLNGCANMTISGNTYGTKRGF